MSDVVTERSDGILRVELNRPERKHALTGAICTRVAEIFNEAAEDEQTWVGLWNGAGDTFSAGNDVGDFFKNTPGLPDQRWFATAMQTAQKPAEPNGALRASKRLFKQVIIDQMKAAIKVEM